MPVPAHPLLTRHSHTPGPVLRLAPDATLALARLHEGCGSARRTFAMMVAARLADQAARSPIWWITPAWQQDQLHAEGVAELLGPERFIHVRPKRAEDVLWTLEEVLRSGAVALAVADIPGLPSLTAVRRLHLAAETGATAGPVPPLGLILTPGPGGAQGVESRWRLQGDHREDQVRWRLDRLRARADPPKGWQVTQTEDRRFVLAPAEVEADMVGLAG